MSKILNLDPDNYKLPLAVAIKILQLCITIYNKFVRDAGFARAGNLAYNTLMAIVPFAALIISLMSAFGALDSVQSQIMDFIVQLLVPTKQAEAKEILDHFLANSNTLGVLGLVFFALTSIMLLNSISENLNAVWGSKVKTKFITKFTTYASVIIFSSLLLAASTTLTSRFSFLSNQSIAIFGNFMVWLAPFIFNFFVILLIIGLTPSGKIQLRYLLLVSVIGAVFWELLKFGFFILSGKVLRMSVIYGTIAIVPIFLFWIYIIWLIIILAMESAWVLQHRNTNGMGTELTEMSPNQRLAFGLGVFIQAAKAYNKGDKPPTIVQLAFKLSVSIQDVRSMSDILISSGLLMYIGEDGSSLIPARSLSKIKTVDLIEALYGEVDYDEMSDEVLMQLDIFYKAGISAVDDVSVEHLLTEETI